MSRGKRLRAPQIHIRIQKLQPRLPFVLRSWFSDPYHVALRNIQWVIVWDDFDYLSAFQSESPHESEPPCRAIKYEAGSLFRIRSRLTTRLAPFFRTIRFDCRFLWGRNAGTGLSPGPDFRRFPTLIVEKNRPGHKQFF